MTNRQSICLFSSMLLQQASAQDYGPKRDLLPTHGQSLNLSIDPSTPKLQSTGQINSRKSTCLFNSVLLQGSAQDYGDADLAWRFQRSRF